MGLALVKHLVELHGGSVSAQSAGEGQGAKFVVRLPLSASEPTAALSVTAHGAVGDTPGSRVLDGLRVLVVDDDTDALDLVVAILTAAGAVVRGSTSAADGLDAVRAWHPDVLVSDIEMPGDDGYWLIHKVRALSEADGGRTPAIALTAYGRTQDRVRSLTAGYTMHVPKPVDPGELTTIIASVASDPARPDTP